MLISQKLAAVAAALAFAAPMPAFCQTSPALGPGDTLVPGVAPITLKVSVNVAGLTPVIAKIVVSCLVASSSGDGIAKGEASIAPDRSGNFNGVVSVPINILGNHQTIAAFSQVGMYFCSLGLQDRSMPPVQTSAGVSGAPQWAQPKSGTPFTGSIQGSIPPK
jgi:hypothetical protein